MKPERLITRQGDLMPSPYEVAVYPAGRGPSKERRGLQVGSVYYVRVHNESGDLMPDHKIASELRSLFFKARVQPTKLFMITRLGMSPPQISRVFREAGPIPYNVGLPAQYWDAIDNRPSERSKRLSESYSSYMRSEHWADLKIKVYERWGHFCMNCSSDAEIDAHHIRYRPRLEDCTTDDIVPLCRRCHDHYHRIKSITPDRLLPIVGAPTPGDMIVQLRAMFGATGFHPELRTSVTIPAQNALQPSLKRRWVAYRSGGEKTSH